MKLRISAWAIRNPLPVALLFIALTLVGLMAYSGLPIKRLPNVTLPIIAVSVGQSGASASEMENQVTRPVENALAGVVGVRHVNSTVTLGAFVDEPRVRARHRHAEGDGRRPHRHRPRARRLCRPASTRPTSSGPTSITSRS